jgi:hypothetical protein
MGSARSAGRAFSPLDEELALLAGSLTPSLQEGLVRLGAWLPFEQAAKLLADLTGAKVSEATARRLTEAAGDVYAQLQEEWVEEQEKGQRSGGEKPRRLVMTTDGVMVPLLKGEWAEVKSLTIGVPEGTTNHKGEVSVQTKQLSYFSRLAEVEVFTRLALAETEQRGVNNAQEVAMVSDGAEWIQGFTDYHRPEAKRILDFPHAGQRLTQVRDILQAAQMTLPDTWLKEELHQLKTEGPTALLTELAQLAQTYPDLPLDEPLGYLQKRINHMQYPTFQAEGWPIGSGASESGNKLVVQARLKGAGMHWARHHVNPMLALRDIVCSDRWHQAWPLIAHRQRHNERQCRTANRQRRLAKNQPSPPPPITFASVQVAPLSQQPSAPPTNKPPYRPPANHPWRRSPIGRARFRPSTHSPSAKL